MGVKRSGILGSVTPFRLLPHFLPRYLDSVLACFMQRSVRQVNLHRNGHGSAAKQRRHGPQSHDGLGPVSTCAICEPPFPRGLPGPGSVDRAARAVLLQPGTRRGLLTQSPLEELSALAGCSWLQSLVISRRDDIRKVRGRAAPSQIYLSLLMDSVNQCSPYMRPETLDVSARPKEEQSVALPLIPR